MLQIIAEIKDNKVIGYHHKQFFRQELTTNFIEGEIEKDINPKYLKVVSGKIEEMTVTEKEVIDLPEIKSQKHSLVTEERNRRAIYEFSFNGNRLILDSNVKDILADRKSDLIAGIANLPFTWRTMDNSFFDSTTEAEAWDLINAVKAHTEKAFQDSWVIKNQIDSASTEAEVNTFYDGYING